MTARLLIGDVYDRIAELPDNSVDLAMTSPPFLALRSYLPDDHPLKGFEIGSERNPAAFIDTLLTLTAELRRVLAPHGSICVELGDTYSGSGGAGGDYGPVGLRSGQPAFDGSAQRTRSNRPGQYGTTTGPTKRKLTSAWPLPKSLCGIPTLYAWSLAYGRNLLTGEPSPAGQWRVRNLVHWVRTNPPVGALGDKYRPATSYLVVACTSAKRWFDLDAVRTAPSANAHARGPKANNLQRLAAEQVTGKRGDDGKHRYHEQHPAGVPPLDWWQLSARGFKGAHYAVYPPELCEKPILSMCPLKVCTVCGEPQRRLTETTYVPHGDAAKHNAEPKAQADHALQQRNQNAQGMAHGRATKVVETVGWSDCGHREWRLRPGVVLDPFAGTGTTLMVAAQHGRDSIGIDIDARNAGLAYDRLSAKGFDLDIDYGLTPTEVLMGAA